MKITLRILTFVLAMLTSCSNDNEEIFVVVHTGLGIREGSHVILNDIEVGSVKDLGLMKDSKILLTPRVNKNVKMLLKDGTFDVFLRRRNGVLSERVVEIKSDSDGSLMKHDTLYQSAKSDSVYRSWNGEEIRQLIKRIEYVDTSAIKLLVKRKSRNDSCDLGFLEKAIESGCLMSTKTANENRIFECIDGEGPGSDQLLKYDDLIFTKENDRLKAEYINVELIHVQTKTVIKIGRITENHLIENGMIHKNGKWLLWPQKGKSTSDRGSR